MINPLNSVGLPPTQALKPLTGTEAAGANPSASGDFGKMLASLASDTVDAIYKGEAMSAAGMQGKASVQQVVDAVMQAEQALHAATAVRDKVVSAYLEISRMTV